MIDVDHACEKAAKAINTSARIMPNNAVPCSSKRHLLATVSSSILKYGDPVWVAALETQRNRVKLTSTFRLIAMQVASACRTISSEEMANWQHDWDSSEKGRWIHRLILVLSTWVNRHGEVTFYLTQFLSGHGCFKQYLHQFGHAVSPFCSERIDVEERPEHAVLACPRFYAALNVENIAAEMCPDEGT
ncbi:uncharacterized protein LOC131688094 [Topomyia yanbarensis]|uniref:uncharacterized protein LOC131688094 n=1 Tax=Topomyia yanbarensis TaxID=2498891 RepID=UPI00273CB159|nr:uncharacterized protein LOC131688094 [Topomyia yanbarensis]